MPATFIGILDIEYTLIGRMLLGNKNRECGHVVEKKRFFTDRDLFKLFLPIVIEQFLEYLVGLADSLMVASVGETAVAGVSLVDFIMALLISLFAALSTGGAVVAGQYLGRSQPLVARNTAKQLVWVAAFSSVAIMLLIYLVKPLILERVFGQLSPEVYAYADRYLMITALSIPFLALYNAGAAIFRTMGNARLPMLIMLAMNMAHAAGNAVLVYGFHFGVEGVAIPTLIARVAAALIILRLTLNKKQLLYLDQIWQPQLNKKLIWQILGIGLPYGLENGLFYLGRIVVLSLVSMFGTAAIAANAVGGTLVMPLVSYSGALVLLADGTRVHSCPMEAGLALEVTERIKKICSMAVVNLYADDSWYAEDVEHPAVQNETVITGVKAQQTEFSTLLRQGTTPHKMLCMCEPGTCAGLAKKLQQAFPMLTIVQSSDILLEIMAGNVSKAAGISVLLAHLKLRPADIVAFGDNYNDLEMIEYAGCGVAMGNAVEKIKAVADQVTASNDEEGIYKFFNRHQR